MTNPTVMGRRRFLALSAPFLVLGAQPLFAAEEEVEEISDADFTLLLSLTDSTVYRDNERHAAAAPTPEAPRAPREERRAPIVTAGVRRLRMNNAHLNDTLDVVYYEGGAYVSDALAEISHFMRDWRNGQVHAIDRRTIDFLFGVQTRLDTASPLTLVSGYRSPETNAMLRSRSSGVARHSLHLTGQASDITVHNRTVAQIARAAVACNGGGVGRYTRSNFVHVDCGRTRTWGT